MSSLAAELASENVQLTTYYPAPSGVYTQMVTTQNTYLARDLVPQIGRVGVGTTAIGLAGFLSRMTVMGETADTTAAALDLQDSGGGHMVWVRNDGNVGIGTTLPNDSLQVGVGAIGAAGVKGTGAFIRQDNALNDILELYPQNLTQGVAIGYDYIKEIGSNANNNLTLDAKGNGTIALQSLGGIGGKVGVRTGAPVGTFSVDGTGTGQRQTIVGDAGCGNNYGGLSVQGALSGCSNYSLLGDGTNLFVNRPGGNIFFRSNNADQVTITAAGLVGVGLTNPIASMDVSGDGVVLSRQVGCSPTEYGAGVQPCGGGQYATMVAGMYSQYSGSGMDPVTFNPASGAGSTTGATSNDLGTGTMVCCPWPGGNWVW